MPPGPGQKNVQALYTAKNSPIDDLAGFCTHPLVLNEACRGIVVLEGLAWDTSGRLTHLCEGRAAVAYNPHGSDKRLSVNFADADSLGVAVEVDGCDGEAKAMDCQSNRLVLQLKDDLAREIPSHRLQRGLDFLEDARAAHGRRKPGCESAVEPESTACLHIF